MYFTWSKGITSKLKGNSVQVIVNMSHCERNWLCTGTVFGMFLIFSVNPYSSANCLFSVHLNNPTFLSEIRNALRFEVFAMSRKYFLFCSLRIGVSRRRSNGKTCACAPPTLQHRRYIFLQLLKFHFEFHFPGYTSTLHKNTSRTYYNKRESSFLIGSGSSNFFVKEVQIRASKRILQKGVIYVCFMLIRTNIKMIPKNYLS